LLGQNTYNFRYVESLKNFTTESENAFANQAQHKPFSSAICAGPLLDDSTIMTKDKGNVQNILIMDYS